jgi:hypothetical protein
LRGQDLNLRPSGYEDSEKSPIEPDSQAIVEVAPPAVVPTHTPKPPTSGDVTWPDERNDNSEGPGFHPDLDRALALARAALALASDAHERSILRELVGLLERPSRRVVVPFRRP